MSALIALFICCAALVLLAAIYIWRRRSRIGGRASDSARRRAVLEDCGDDVVWEIGKLRPIVATPEFEARMGKRAFLRRVAFSVSAFLVAWLASRGRSVAAFGMEPRPAEGRLSGKVKPMDIHSDSMSHTDDHTDSGGDNHVDFHSDAPGTHTDTGGNLESRSAKDRLSGKDRP
ncbi:MAG TPA: hypothetical protein VG733_06075, partial [Chthoniobacteraceae bacterium]|nr:hypothetical protein [Chthoniobacteraceae bacterium]